MAAIRHLDRPPIAEAVINFQVQVPGRFDKQGLNKVPPAFKDFFPVAKQIRKNQFAFQLDQGVPRAEGIKTQVDETGFRFENGDGSRVAIFDWSGSFIYSQVNGYQSWEALISEAKSAWEVFKSIVAPTVVTRIGLRYINKCQFDLPADSTDLLNAAPTLPASLGVETTGFFSQVSVELPVGASANVTQMLQHEPKASFVIIDVDVYKQGISLDPATEAIWDVLVPWREWKNKIFFSLVTEKLLEKNS